MVSNILAWFVVYLRSSYGLMTKPYMTMRSLSKETALFHTVITGVLIGLYFLYATIIRSRSVNVAVLVPSVMALSLFALGTFILVQGFIYISGFVLKALHKADPQPFRALLTLAAYGLIPTMLWFYVTSTLYVLFPPPRYVSFLGVTFGVIFLVFSISMLLWRIMLFYLTIRFALRARFLSVIAVMVAFFVWFLPYVIFMYELGIFRIPFV